jgi:hypothetical protein
MRIRDGNTSDPGWKKSDPVIRDKHSGSGIMRKTFAVSASICQYFRTAIRSGHNQDKMVPKIRKNKKLS